MPYLARLGWLVVQPAKVWSEIVIYTRKVKSPMISLLRSRHFPPAFEDVLSIYNKLGPVLPVSQELAKTMPNLFRLLSLNTFSLSRMSNLLGEDEETGVETNRAGCMYYDGGNPGDKQVSNVPMMILVLAFLQVSTFLPPDSEQHQSLLAFTEQGAYQKLFGKGRAQYLGEDDDGDSGMQGFCSRYKDNIAIRYQSLPKSESLSKKELYDEYSVVEVIYGLLGITSSKSAYPLTEGERTKIDKALGEFELQRHYYDVLQNPSKVSSDWPDRTQKACPVILPSKKKKTPLKKAQKAGKKKGKGGKEEATDPGSELSEVSEKQETLEPEKLDGNSLVPDDLSPLVFEKELDLEINRAMNVAVRLALQRAAYNRARNEIMHELITTKKKPPEADNNFAMLRDDMDDVLDDHILSLDQTPFETQKMSELLLQLTREAAYEMHPMPLLPDVESINGLTRRTEAYLEYPEDPEEPNMFDRLGEFCQDTVRERYLASAVPPSKFKNYINYMKNRDPKAKPWIVASKGVDGGASKKTPPADAEAHESGEVADGDKKPSATVTRPAIPSKARGKPNASKSVGGKNSKKTPLAIDSSDDDDDNLAVPDYVAKKKSERETKNAGNQNSISGKGTSKRPAEANSPARNTRSATANPDKDHRKKRSKIVDVPRFKSADDFIASTGDEYTPSSSTSE